MVYDSNETGNYQIYATEIETGRRWALSTDGGITPLWPSAGSEILYQRLGDTWAVPVDLSGDEFVAGSPTRVSVGTATINSDASADGRRMLLRRESGSFATNEEDSVIKVVLNWFADLRARIPTDR